MRHKYYVGILEDGGRIMFVTGISNLTKTAIWGGGEPAKRLSREAARELAYGLRCNGYAAVVVSAPWESIMSNAPRNPSLFDEFLERTAKGDVRE